jgi:hypothetical protein
MFTHRPPATARQDKTRAPESTFAEVQHLVSRNAAGLEIAYRNFAALYIGSQLL